MEIGAKGKMLKATCGKSQESRKLVVKGSQKRDVSEDRRLRRIGSEVGVREIRGASQVWMIYHHEDWPPGPDGFP